MPDSCCEFDGAAREPSTPWFGEPVVKIQLLAAFVVSTGVAFVTAVAAAIIEFDITHDR